MAKTVIICWPSVQNLMDQPGFREHSALCCSDEMYNSYGDSSYAVDEDWLETLDVSLIEKIFSLQETFKGPDINFDEEQVSEEIKII